MGRRAQGYQLRKPRKPGHCWSVRFRIDGNRFELSTGETDRRAADQKARQIYANAIKGRRQERRRQRRATGLLTPWVVATWLADVPYRATTIAQYEQYSTYWIKRIPDLSDEAISSYVRARLRECLGGTVSREISALRGFCRWLVDTRRLQEMPAFPRFTSSTLGTPAKKRGRSKAPELSEAEVKAVLRRIPDKSPRDGFWVRPRCELLWETGLRPSTIDALSVPEHWSPGSASLNITADIDKEGYAREVPLSPRALAILKRCARKPGVIFGRHVYEEFTKPAARKALTAAKARVFTSQHLRSARATHLLERTGDMPGTQYLLGHVHASTTARYVRPTFRAASSVLDKLSGED